MSVATKTGRPIVRFLVFVALSCLAAGSYRAFAGGSGPGRATPSEPQAVPLLKIERREPLGTTVSRIADGAKMVAVWGIVPLGVEILLTWLDGHLTLGPSSLKRVPSTQSLFIKRQLSRRGVQLITPTNAAALTVAVKSFWQVLYEVNRRIVQMAASAHLTDYVSSVLETVSYRSLSQHHLELRTFDTEQELRARSLRSSALLSAQAQKGLKTYMRLARIFDEVFTAARLAFSRLHLEEAARMVAFGAMVMLYVHPDIPSKEMEQNVRFHFSSQVDWNELGEFRTFVERALYQMDPLFGRFTMFNFHYCLMLNDWGISNRDCSELSRKAGREIAGFSGISALSPNHMRFLVFLVGVFLPAALLHKAVSADANTFSPSGKRVVESIAEHFARIFGLAISGPELQRYGENVRQFLRSEEYLSEESLASGGSARDNYANNLFERVQTSAGSMFAEQVNFNRSNIQHYLDAVVLAFAGAHRARLKGDGEHAAGILAALAVQLRHELVEMSVNDVLIRAAATAFSPIQSTGEVTRVLDQISVYDTRAEDFYEMQAYTRVLVSWRVKGSRADAGTSPAQRYWQDRMAPDTCGTATLPQIFTKDRFADLGNTSWTEEVSVHDTGWGVATKNLIVTSVTHALPILTGVAAALLTRNFASSCAVSRFGMFGSILLGRSLDVGLRSLTEPAAIELQTAYKDHIDAAVGAVSEEVAAVQDHLTERIDVLERKLSAEAQHARAHRMALEPVIIQALSVASDNAKARDLIRPLAHVAYAAYLHRFLYPEVGSGDLVLAVLARSRLIPLHRMLAEGGLEPAACSIVFAGINFLDPHATVPEVRTVYAAIAEKWGFGCSASTVELGAETATLWQRYADVGVGSLGMTVQAGFRAVCNLKLHGGAGLLNLVERSFCELIASVTENSSTDALRKRLQSQVRIAISNIVTFESGVEIRADREANERLEDEYRRVKFHFSHPEIEVRAQFMVALASVYPLMREAERLQAETVDNGRSRGPVHYVALALLRILVFFPQFQPDDPWVGTCLRQVFGPLASVLDLEELRTVADTIARVEFSGFKMSPIAREKLTKMIDIIIPRK